MKIEIIFILPQNHLQKRKKKMDFNYKVWCLSRLTKTEYIVYSLISDLGTGNHTFQEIAKCTGSSHREVIRIVKKLEGEQFLLAYTDGGLYTLWLRSHPEEVIPNKKELIKEASAIVRSPNGDELYIPPNGIYEFARDHQLIGMTLWNLLHCKASKNRQGWELIKGFSSFCKPPENNNEIISRLTAENEALKLQRDSLQKELYELNIEAQDLRRQVKDLSTEKPGTVPVSVKYLAQLKDQIALLENENKWLKVKKVA